MSAGRCAYFSIMGADADRIPLVAPEHTAHWHDLAMEDYEGGPFEDGTGGLITIRAESHAQADRAVTTDPFVRDGLLETYWIKQWNPQWATHAFIEYDHLIGDAGNSPLVTQHGTPHQLTVGAGFAYSFDIPSKK